jgi:hypothetical protein
MQEIPITADNLCKGVIALKPSIRIFSSRLEMNGKKEKL